MITCTIAPGHWLRADAAASYQRMRAAGMPAGGITDAGRTRAEQEAMYARYLRGELVAYAARPGTSKHESGTALDLSGAARAWVRTYGTRYGWLRDQVPREPWHMEYVPALDLAAAFTPITPTQQEDDDMRDDERLMLQEVHAALGAGGAVGMDERRTVLGVARAVQASTNGLPDALGALRADTAGVPDVLAQIIRTLSTLQRQLTELIGVTYAGTDGTPVSSTIYQRTKRIDEKG